MYWCCILFHFIERLSNSSSCVLNAQFCRKMMCSIYPIHVQLDLNLAIVEAMVKPQFQNPREKFARLCQYKNAFCRVLRSETVPKNDIGSSTKSNTPQYKYTVHGPPALWPIIQILPDRLHVLSFLYQVQIQIGTHPETIVTSNPI